VDGTPTASWIGERYAKAEYEFENAIAEGLLERRKDRRFNFKDIQDLWPSAGRGNSKKHFLDRDLLDKITTAIVCGPDGQTRADVFREIGSKGIVNRGKQRGPLLAATDKALHVLESAGHPLVISPSEAQKYLNDPELSKNLSEPARKSLAQLTQMKELLPEERNAAIQHVKTFKKGTLPPSRSPPINVTS
jgi:hypothetical protein